MSSKDSYRLTSYQVVWFRSLAIFHSSRVYVSKNNLKGIIKFVLAFPNKGLVSSCYWFLFQVRRWEKVTKLALPSIRIWSRISLYVVFKEILIALIVLLARIPTHWSRNSARHIRQSFFLYLSLNTQCISEDRLFLNRTL